MNAKIVFFGTSSFAVTVLETLKARGIVAALIITTKDMPKGRNLALTPPPVKLWADKMSIPVLQPENLKDEPFTRKLAEENYDLFIVASYGKIIPREIIDLPRRKTLNIHPSLLPKLRGPSPVQTAILADEKETGVTIIEIDEKMDHGPIVSQKKVEVADWPTNHEKLEELLAKVGASLLADILPEWLEGAVKALPQDERDATYTKKIEKEDAEINLNDDPYLNYRKIMAYGGWPNAYFFADRKGKRIRVTITEASLEDGALKIKKVIPEGKREMTYEEFLRGL
ncbi:MAG: methionyl-tRNA formyltransferase [bacterium]|nr:methionyl-tRNA formyltransferase [bacterium]